MERKITHYVVKPEHKQHHFSLTGSTLLYRFEPGSHTFNILTEAKVLDLWCTAVYEKPRVKGWYGVGKEGGLMGPYSLKENIPVIYCTQGRVFIDQEIE